MSNRLANSSSPYLRQHAENPVEWFEWGEEAFASAREQAKPIFLSVGYSSCHWCHVMAHESFEDFEVASVLNRGFVSIKVDREERPDVDEAYMTAVQLQSGRGGWPMTVLMTPDGDPFFAGTYIPKDDRGQYPGFLSILRQIEELWTRDRPKVEGAARDFRDSLEEALRRSAPEAAQPLDAAFLTRAIETIAAEFDPVHGGFGGAPKFPPHTTLQFFLAAAESPILAPEICAKAKEMAHFTLEQIALGGLHDHVGGGFHRYSTDAVWLVPHFEKMLYDNSLLLGNFARAARQSVGSRRELFESAAKGIVRWFREEMQTPDGLFGSALDADSEGAEGKFYVWSKAEIESVLGESADKFCREYGITEEGNYRDEASGRRTGANIPHLRKPA